MPSELVSVIIPCYRQAHFLPTALESVLAQSHGAIEPVVVNDGSDDDTAAVAARYGDKIHYVAQSNQGLAAARNRGIQEAEGKYLLFLDADDLLHPDAVSWQVEAMAGREDRLSLLGYRYFSEDPFATGLREVIPRDPFSFFPSFIHHCHGPPHCFLSSRRLVIRAGSFQCLRRGGCEDWDLWLRQARLGADLVTIPRLGAYYRRHPGTMSSDERRMLESRSDVLLRLHRRLVDAPELLRSWGAELLKAEQRICRKCIAQGAQPCYAAELARAMAELTRRGFRIEESFPKALLRMVLGEQAERIAFTLVRWFCPNRAALYKKGYV